MTEAKPTNGHTIGAIYDKQTEEYAKFSDKRYAWEYLEKPAFDRYVSDFYLPQTRVLDIGCGTGVVARHLILRGISPQNIIGIDVSREQIKKAKAATPGAEFLLQSADEFDLPPGCVDLVITNTVLHHLDNEQLKKMLTKVYDVLSPGGTYFFVDVDPDHSAEGRDPENTNKWTAVNTPWGTEVPFFNRNPYDLVDTLDRCGFDKVAGWVLKVAPEGIIEPQEFIRYSSRPSRMAARYQKVSEAERILRFNDVKIPNLIETREQQVQRKLVEQYFQAWQTQSLDIIANIFSSEATYDEKPGIEVPLKGIEAIKNYWRINPLSQKNIHTNFKVVGFSDHNSIWTEFNGNFDVRSQHIDINGVIGFAIDPSTRKIIHLTESFTTDKIPIKEWLK